MVPRHVLAGAARLAALQELDEVGLLLRGEPELEAGVVVVDDGGQVRGGARNVVHHGLHGQTPRLPPKYFVNPVMTIPGFGTITTRACAEA